MMDKKAAWIGSNVLPFVIGWLEEGEKPNVRAIQRRAMRAGAAEVIGREALGYIMMNTGDLISWVALAADKMNVHGILSYWITDEGQIFDTNVSPQKEMRGHAGWVIENAQFLTENFGLDLPDQMSQQEGDKAALNLLNRGWLRLFGVTVASRAMPNDAQFSALQEFMPEIQAKMGVDDNFSFTLMNDDVRSVHTTLGEFQEKGKEAFDPAEGDEATVQASVRTADTGGGMGGPFDQSDGFEKQPDFTDFINDGSPGWREKQLSYMPQDWTPEVWWGRSLLDYMKQKYPGKKDVGPPETNVGPSTPGPAPFASADNGMERSAIDPGQTLPQTPSTPSPSAETQSTDTPSGQGLSTGRPDMAPATTPGTKTPAQNTSPSVPDLEIPDRTTFTAWERVMFRRIGEMATEQEALMSESDAPGILWRPDVRIAVLLNINAKWKEDYTDEKPKRENFFRFVGIGAGNDKGKNFVAHIIGDLPSERGLYTALSMEIGGDQHTRYDYESSDHMVAFVNKFWRIKNPMDFKKLDAKEFLPKLWVSYRKDPRTELLRFILNSNAEGAEDFIAKQLQSRRTSAQVKKAILDAYIKDPNLIAVPKALLNEMAIPILTNSILKGDSDAAEALITLPDAEEAVSNILQDPSGSSRTKKLLIDAIIDNPKAKSAPKVETIKDLIREYRPQELEKMEVPALFEEQTTVLSRNPKEHKLMERALRAWTDSTNQFTSKLVAMLKLDEAKKENVSKWLKQVGAWNERIESMIPDPPTLTNMQKFIGILNSTLETMERYKGKKMLPFTHKVNVEYQDRGFFRVYLSMSDVTPPPVPTEVVTKLMAHHGSQEPLAWAELTSFVLTSKEAGPVRVWAVTELQSDVEQRAAKLGVTPEQQTERGDRYTMDLPEDWGQYRSALENWIEDWHKILLNMILKRAQEYGVVQVWIETAASLESRWGSYLRNKRTDDGENSAAILYKRVYDAQAKEYGAREMDVKVPPEVEGKDFWIVDVAGIPTERFAMIRLSEEEDDAEFEKSLEPRVQWSDEIWKAAIIAFFKENERIYKRLSDYHHMNPQEVLDIWYMISVPQELKFDEQFLNKVVGWVREMGHNVALPSQVRSVLQQREREDIAETEEMVRSIPEVTEDTLLDMGVRMERMPEGPNKEKAKERIEDLRKQISATIKGLIREAWGAGGRGTFNYVYEAWQKGKSRKRGNYQTDGTILYVFGNEVLRGTPDNFEITDAGWQTQTTKAALDTIMDEQTANWGIFTNSGNWFLWHGRPNYDDKKDEWDIDWKDFMKGPNSWAWPSNTWVRFTDGHAVSFKVEGERHTYSMQEHGEGEHDFSKMTPGSVLMDQIAEERRDRQRLRREKNKEAEFVKQSLVDLINRAAGGSVSPREAEALVDIARSFDYGYIEGRGAEIEQVGDDGVRAAQFLQRLIEENPDQISTLTSRMRMHFKDLFIPQATTVQEPMMGEAALLNRIVVGDVTDPSDTDGQHDQVGNFDNHLLNPDSILYKGKKGRGVPFGNDDGDGQGELRTNLPAARAGTVKTAVIEHFNDMYWYTKIEDDVRQSLSDRKGAADYEFDTDMYSYSVSILGDEHRAARAMDMYFPESVEDREFFADDLEQNLQKIADEGTIELHKRGFPGSLVAGWDDGDLRLDYVWDKDDMENFSVPEGVEQSQEQGPIEGEEHRALVASTPWQIVKRHRRRIS